MRSGEHWDGWPPDDPPQGGRWCSVCSHWDDDCECPDPDDEPVIIVEHICPPIPIRNFDYVAYLDGKEDGPIGHGRTEQEAKENLKEALQQ